MGEHDEQGELVWLSEVDPRPMLLALSPETSVRRLRLFSTACCRRLWRLFDDENGRRAIELAEQCADGGLTVHELFAIQKQMDFVHDYDRHQVLADRRNASREAISAAHFAAMLIMGFHDAQHAATVAEWATSAVALEALGDKIDDFEYEDQEGFEEAARPFKELERAAQASILRDIFPNPTCTVSFDPRWSSEECLSLARRIYNQNDFDQLPYLGELLLSADCTDKAILDHCRSDETHVKGCWVVDALLEIASE